MSGNAEPMIMNAQLGSRIAKSLSFSGSNHIKL